MEANTRFTLIRSELLTYAAGHHISKTRLLLRFQIMLLQQNGVSVRQCAWYLNCSLTTIRKWSKAVTENVRLLDAKRPGRPRLFTETTRLKIIGFYCQNPLAGCHNWSFSWAANYLNLNPDFLGRKISASTIHRILREHGMRPHLIKYFLQITDPDFFPKMEHITAIYLNPPKHLFCWDECTGLQALERLGVELVTDNGFKIEFQYRRHGTRDLCAILNYHTGRVFGKCTDNHRKETIAQLLEEHVKEQPCKEQLHYICDNLAGHSTELFCTKVAELSGVHYPADLNTKEKRRQWLQSEEKRIVFHFVPYHGSWLNLIEIWFGILQSKCLKGSSFVSVDELIRAIYGFIETWNQYFSHPFNWTYTGEGLFEKVVQRLISWLLAEIKNMEQKFFYKQLLLMNNLVCDYWKKVPEKRWKSLYNTLFEKQDYINNIIAGNTQINKTLTQLISILSAKLSTTIQVAA